MSIASSFQSTLNTSVSSSRGGTRSDIFQDLPFMDKGTRLTVVELKQSEKQIVNELVYRWCRILTRVRSEASHDNRRVLLIDLIGSISLTRLAVVLKEDYGRMQMINMVRGCKINSTYVTLNSYIGTNSSLSRSIKLVVIYQDEFYILKTLTLLKECLQNIRCKVLLVVPRLDRSERDVLNLISNYQILRCDFCIKRRDIGPALAENDETYQSSLNKVCFHRFPSNKQLPDIVYAHIKIDGLNKDEIESKPPLKKIRSDAQIYNTTDNT